MRYPLTERGMVSAVNGDGTMDVTVSGRAHPYAGLQVMGGSGGVNAGDMVDVGFIDRHLHGRRWMPFVISSTGPRRTTSSIPTPEPESAGYWTSPFRDGGQTCWDPGTEMPACVQDAWWQPAALGLAGGTVMGMVTYAVGGQDVIAAAVYDSAGWHVSCVTVSTGAVLWTRSISRVDSPDTDWRRHLVYSAAWGELVLALAYRRGAGTTEVYRINATTGVLVGTASSIPCDLTYGYTLTATMLVGGMKDRDTNAARRVRAWRRDATNTTAFELPAAWTRSIAFTGPHWTRQAYVDQWGPPAYYAGGDLLLAPASWYAHRLDVGQIYQRSSVNAITAETGAVAWQWLYAPTIPPNSYLRWYNVGLATDLTQNVVVDSSGTCWFWCGKVDGYAAGNAVGHYRIVSLTADGSTAYEADVGSNAGDSNKDDYSYLTALSGTALVVARYANTSTIHSYASSSGALRWRAAGLYPAVGPPMVGGGSTKPWVLVPTSHTESTLVDALTGEQASATVMPGYCIPHGGYIYASATDGTGAITLRRWR